MTDPKTCKNCESLDAMIKELIEALIDTLIAKDEVLSLLTAIEKNTAPRVQQKRDKPPEAYTEDFEAFWKVYPRKIGKGAAFKAWQTKKPPFRIVMAAVASCLTHIWQNSEKRFIPHPATWLNEKRWQDCPDSKPIPTTKPKCQFCGDETHSRVGRVPYCFNKDECYLKAHGYPKPDSVKPKNGRQNK